MYEVMYYMGIVLAAFFFAASVILFFYNRIIEVCQYFIKNKTPVLIQHEKTEKVKTVVKSNDEPTEYFEKVYDETEILDKAQEFATALLEADKTEILHGGIEE